MRPSRNRNSNIECIRVTRSSILQRESSKQEIGEGMLIEPQSLFDLLVQVGIYHLVNGDGERNEEATAPATESKNKRSRALFTS